MSKIWANGLAIAALVWPQFVIVADRRIILEPRSFCDFAK
jgi:hypothetical protein